MFYQLPYIPYTVEPRFTNLIRSWRLFVTRNVQKPNLLWSNSVLFNNILKNHKTQWNSSEGTANWSRDMYWAKVTQQLTLSRWYSQLVANRCSRLACLLLETPFVTRDFVFSEICSWTDLFVMRGVREPRFHCREKQYKVWQVTLPLVTGVGCHSASLRHLNAVCEASNAVAMTTAKSTLIYHSQPAQPSWSASLSSALYLETPLRPMYINLTAFLCHILSYKFLWYTLFKPWQFIFTATLLPLPWDTMSPHCWF
jgi:hypothetical protein